MTLKLKADIAAWASDLGFTAIGFTSPAAIPGAAARLAQFVAEGRHGDMAWLGRDVDRRGSPTALWPQARTAIMLAASYAPPRDPRDALSQADRGVISAYAKRRDYHDVLKSRLKELAGRIASDGGGDVKVFVDTAPLMEKPLAAAAGIGWQGKHTNLVSRTSGSWLFLGSILTTLDLSSDAPALDHCGSCRRCLDICPTDAFPAPYQLDARRCIAYLTIEYRGHIAREFREPIGNRVFGCDDCLAVCPWNSFAQASADQRLAIRDDLDDPPLHDLLKLDDAAFRSRFAGTPVKRTGRDRFIRNTLIAAGNSGDRSLSGLVESHLTDDSPLVRAMAVWALSRLQDHASFKALSTLHSRNETDPDVQSEWRDALASIELTSAR